MAWSYTYDITTPAFDDDPSEADDRMREIKGGLQERLNVEHVFDFTGSEVSHLDSGKHTDITTTSITNAGVLTQTGNLILNTDKFTVDAATGNIAIAGNAAIVGDVTIAGTLGVTGVATLGDGSKLATSAAPGADAELANKKYVDDQKTKAWVNFTGRNTNGVCILNDSFNVTSVTRTATGHYTIAWDTNFANAHYVWVGSGHKSGSSIFVRGNDSYAAGTDQTASVAYIECTNHAGANNDPDRCRIIANGNQ